MKPRVLRPLALPLMTGQNNNAFAKSFRSSAKKTRIFPKGLSKDFQSFSSGQKTFRSRDFTGIDEGPQALPPPALLTDFGGNTFAGGTGYQTYAGKSAFINM